MSLQNTKVLIMAGGTGGHIFPALTIARELLARGAQVEWLGTRQGLEARVIGETDIPLHFITIGGLRGKGMLKLALAPFAVLRALFQALRTIARVRPGCVLGMGGFVTGPGGLAARLLGSKLLIHEQNAVAGLSNQLLFPFAHVVMEAFPGAFRRRRQVGPGVLAWMIRPERPVLIGNPVRPEILQLPPLQQRQQGREGPLRLLVIGGSLGAAAINSVLPQYLSMLPATERPLVWHQCGSRNLDQSLQAYADAGLELSGSIRVEAFIDDMAAAYEWADLVICRAGASTVAELAAAGLPSILVPYPSAVDDHQSANAQVLEHAGAAWLVQQPAFTALALKEILEPLAGDRKALLQRAQAALAVAIPDAGSRAAQQCLEACND